MSNLYHNQVSYNSYLFCCIKGLLTRSLRACRNSLQGLLLLYTPNLHTGTGLVERTIRTIKSLTKANMADSLTFEESIQLAIKTIRQTPHSRLKMTPFQMHFGRKPRTALTNLIGKPDCLLSN